MEEILASIRRIIEPEGQSSAPVFTSLSGGDAPAASAAPAGAPLAAIVAEVRAEPAPPVAAPELPAFEPLVQPAPEPRPVEAVEAAPMPAAARPWGVEANDARPLAPAARPQRSPVTAGFDRFASALQRLNRRPERSAAAASVAAVSVVAASRSNLAQARALDTAVRREETSLAVAKLRAVADTIGQRSRGDAVVAVLPAPEPVEIPAVLPDARVPEIVAEAPLAPVQVSASVIVLPQPTLPEAERPFSDGSDEPETVAEFITVVPPPAANDSALARADGAAGFDEAELMMALNEELDREPAEGSAAPVVAPLAIAAPEPRVAELRRLIAEEAGGRTADAFADMASAVRAGALGSMDEIVREILKPMLREWMDDNLPHLVERMVADEIQRAARGPAAA